MKIIIVNKFLYSRGGDCICAMNLRQLLENNGHEVRYFAMEYPQNIECKETIYFPKEVSFSSPGIKNKMEAVNRILFGGGVKQRFQKLIDDFKPDVVHLHNIHSYLSPILAKIAYSNHIKVIWTLHDYKLICPSYSCLCNDEICEACFIDKSQVLRRKCMKNSFVASGLAWIEALQWNQQKLSKWTAKFICPSRFMADKMVQGGFAQEKLQVLCNFIDDEKAQLIESIQIDEKEKAYCYIGRLSKEKGIEQLLSVAIQLSYKLYIAGDGPLFDELKERYKAPNIIFLGHLNYEEIIKLLKSVLFSVVPSIWYENNPLSVIESLCSGTPVLGARIGGIPELLTDNYSQLYGFDNLNELKRKISFLFDDSLNYDRSNLSKSSLDRFSGLNYYNNILKVYKLMN